MAVIFSKTVGRDRYEVRNAGQSIRLYKNRVFHSQWNPKRPLSSGVWDLLFLPALFLPVTSVKRVLLLGVGGGAVINQYIRLLSPERVIGVELDAQHLSIAKRFFLTPHPAVELHCADAIQWLEHYRGPAFDVIIEDLFTERDGEPERVIDTDVHWFSTLRRHLNPDGVLVINFEDPGQMRESGRVYRGLLGDNEDIRYQFSQPTYGNSVCAFLHAPATPRYLREQLAEILVQYPASREAAQRFRVRRVS
jgi:spermidine synthase